jgi:hypothetical protein
MLAFAMGPGDQQPRAAEMIVTRFAPGNTGTFLDNINRWRGQIGLEPIPDATSVKMRDVKVGQAGQAIEVEFENPASTPPKRTIVVIASAREDLWFFKLSGVADVVAQQREALDQFMKSIEFGGEEPGK